MEEKESVRGEWDTAYFDSAKRLWSYKREVKGIETDRLFLASAGLSQPAANWMLSRAPLLS